AHLDRVACSRDCLRRCGHAMRGIALCGDAVSAHDARGWRRVDAHTAWRVVRELVAQLDVFCRNFLQCTTERETGARRVMHLERQANERETGTRPIWMVRIL